MATWGLMFDKKKKIFLLKKGMDQTNLTALKKYLIFYGFYPLEILICPLSVQNNKFSYIDSNNILYPTLLE